MAIVAGRALRLHASAGNLNGMSWTCIAHGQVDRTPLELYRSGADFMIRVGGYELMNSRWSRSEIAMARFARECCAISAPRILVGGLGLGFTLAAVIGEFPISEIVVAEISEEVLGWYREHFKPSLFSSIDDARVDFRHCDVSDVLRRESFDLILLDVDNGPRPVSTPKNAQLYDSAGLKLWASALRAGGSVILWSAFAAREFQIFAEHEGWRCTCREVAVGWREHSHFLYRLIK